MVGRAELIESLYIEFSSYPRPARIMVCPDCWPVDRQGAIPTAAGFTSIEPPGAGLQLRDIPFDDLEPLLAEIAVSDRPAGVYKHYFPRLFGLPAEMAGLRTGSEFARFLGIPEVERRRAYWEPATQL